MHLSGQAAKSYVERSNAFALVPGHGVLADCSAAEQPPLKALLSRDMRRSEGSGRSKGSQTSSWMQYRTLWMASRSRQFCDYTQSEARQKRQWNSSWAKPADSKTEPSHVPASRIIRREAPRRGRDVAPPRAGARAAARAAPTPAG